jgi:cytochrome c oxidase subunit IV
MSDPTPPAAAAGAPHGGHGHGHEHHPHIVPIWQIAAVLSILVVLTVVTVLVAYVTPSVPIAVAIASVKAALVCMFFMHLKWDKPFNSLILIISVGLLGLFLAFAILDTTTYADSWRPEYSAEGFKERRAAWVAEHGEGGH